MEIAVMSVPWIEELTAYGHSRFPVRLFFPLALFISMAGQVGSQGGDPDSLAISTFLSFGLLFQFRLWDDLSDQARDLVDYPDRILSKTNATENFRILLFGSGLFNFMLVLLIYGHGHQSSVFVLLSSAFLLWYQWLRSFCSNPFLCYHVLLIKYPAFVYLLNRSPFQNPGVHLFLSMALVYFSFCIYEVLHDKRLHRLKSALKVLFIEMSAMIFISAMIVISSSDRGRPAVLLQSLLAVLGVFVLATLFKRHKGGFKLNGWRYSAFVVAFFQILAFSLSEGL